VRAQQAIPVILSAIQAFAANLFILEGLGTATLDSGLQEARHAQLFDQRINHRKHRRPVLRPAPNCAPAAQRLFAVGRRQLAARDLSRPPTLVARADEVIE
jgi:hypothetical protein